MPARCRLRLAAPLLAVLAGAGPAPARAALLGLELPSPDPLERGPVDLKPYASYSETYDSNIYLQPGASSAWVHAFGAGARAAARPSPRQRLDLSYDAVQRLYSRDPSLNDALNQALSLSGLHRAGAGLDLRAADAYVNTVDPATSELTQRRRRWSNAATAQAIYAPENAFLIGGADAGQTVDKYVSSPELASELNRYTQRAGAAAGVRLAPKTRLYAAYHRQLIHYTAHPAPPSRDSKAHLLDLGLEGTLTARLAGSARTGLESRRYDEEAVPGAGRLSRHWTAAVRLEYRAPRRTWVDLALDRSLQESTFGANRYYLAASAGLSVAHDFPWRTRLALTASFEQDRYPEAEAVRAGLPPATRRDDLYQAGASLEYALRPWLKLAAAYSYRARFSPRFAGEFDYRDSLTSAAAALSWR